MRLDVYLFENGITSSRTEARHFIDEGAVYVNGKQIRKASFDICGDEDVSVDRSLKRFVSRGGIKLGGALNEFKVSVMGRLCLDVGASSGGFTDCLLQYGAKHVIAVDSGSGQLVDSIRRDSRVTVFESYNARYMRNEDLAYSPELVVMDVSFISATYIMPAVYNVMSEGGDYICLIKPQFEVGRSGLGKGGIVKDARARELAKNKVLDFAAGIGFELKGIIQSSIKGGDGNIEYLAHFVKPKGE